MAVDNKKTLDDGFRKGLALIEGTLVLCLRRSASELIHRALVNREYMGFTGNTQTSYTCGVFLNGVLVTTVSSQAHQDAPIRRKIKLGKTVYLENPYEGSPRIRSGHVKVDSRFGSETALKFINSYHAPKRGIALVMTTGTEYSEFLEAECNLDVLTKTFNEASKVLQKNWRPIV